tara:strand:+ start:2283 stop:3176 length:894 start_codon:yes stop_codon:yes gene_type:complete
VQKYKIGIAGLGGIGGLLGVLFENKGYKIFSSKLDNKKLVTFNLKSNYYGNLDAKIIVNSNLKDANIIFICSKYQYLKKHLKKINNKNALIIPILNGRSHFEILKKKFNNKIFIANIGKVVSKINKKNQILHSSNNAPEVLISSEKKNKKDLRTIKNVLSKIRLKVKIKSKNSDVIWSKLIRLSPISALTALYNCNLGQIRSSKLKMDQLNTLIKETLIISKKNDNYRDSYTNVKNLIKSLPDKLNTSLQRDINSGVSSELETQIGSIVKLSKKLNISSPMNEKIYLLLKKKCQKRF